MMTLGLPRWLKDKESACQAGDVGLIPKSGRSPREGHGNPTPIFLPGESRGQRGAWWGMVHGVAELDSTEHACTHTHMRTPILNMIILLQMNILGFLFLNVVFRHRKNYIFDNVIIWITS